MVADMSYLAVSNVVESWEDIRRDVKDFEEVAGVLLFRRFFELDPSALPVFSFGSNHELTDEFFASPRLRKHAKYFIQMIGRAIGLLGPDIELLTDILLQLGKKHSTFGVKPSHFPPMGAALLEMLKELLGEKYTDEIKDAWVEVYQALSYDMMRAHDAKE